MKSVLTSIYICFDTLLVVGGLVWRKINGEPNVIDLWGIFEGSWINYVEVKLRIYDFLPTITLDFLKIFHDQTNLWRNLRNCLNQQIG